MNEIIAALDNSLAATPVINTALALCDVLEARIAAVHVAVDGDRVAQNAAERAGVSLRTRQGVVADELLDEAGRDDVLALVLGARGTPGDRRPLGSTAVAIATMLRKPVVVVPPENGATEVSRVLVPVERGVSAWLTPRAIVEVAQGASVEIVVLHVHEPATIPRFSDQPQHEQVAWSREFLRRYVPWGIGSVRLEVRAGNAEELVPLVAREAGAHMIALGWSQELAAGRAPVVRSALAHAKVPVMLVPVEVRSSAGDVTSKEESWSKSPSSRA